MIYITAAELLNNRELFALFSVDDDDPAWSPELAAEHCRLNPDTLLTYDGTHWDVVDRPREWFVNLPPLPWNVGE